MVDFMPVAGVPPSFRNKYLASLPEPQEWFLEEMVRSGEVWAAPDVGYGVFHGDTLVEFFAPDADQAAGQLRRLFEARPFAKGLGKSFDRVLMQAAAAMGWDLVETGYLFRKRTPVSRRSRADLLVRRSRADLLVRRAEPGDLAQVWQTGGDFYEDTDEIARIFGSGGLWVACDGGAVVGSGVMIPIDGSGAVVDIGMVTRPDQRGKGIASAVIAALADALEGEGKRPVCGCAQSNHASKAALEKAGFVSEHRLVQIVLP